MELTKKQQNEIKCLDYFAMDRKYYEIDSRFSNNCSYNKMRKRVWKKETRGRKPPSVEDLSKKYNIEKEYFLFSGKIGGLEEDTLIYDWEEDRIIIAFDLTEDKKGISGEEAYFEASDKGKLQICTNNTVRFAQLWDAKKWRLRSMDMYEQGIKDVPYFTLLGLEPDLKKIEGKWKEIKPIPVPKYVMEFIAKTIFKGTDKEIVKELYYEEIKKIEKKWGK